MKFIFCCALSESAGTNRKPTKPFNPVSVAPAPSVASAPVVPAAIPPIAVPESVVPATIVSAPVEPATLPPSNVPVSVAQSPLIVLAPVASAAPKPVSAATPLFEPSAPQPSIQVIPSTYVSGPTVIWGGNSGRGNCKVALFADSTFMELNLDIDSIMNRVSGMFQSDLGFGLQTLKFIDADGDIFNTTAEVASSGEMQGEAAAFLQEQGFGQSDFCSRVILTKRVLTIGNGFGSVGSMCNGGVAVASAMGGERDLDLAGIARVIAHEMGHNFGARHGSIGKHFIINPPDSN